MGSTRRILAVLLVLFGFVSAPASAAVITYLATLTGAAESPPNASPGIGDARIDFDDVTSMMRVRANFAGLIGTTTAAHIHCCTANPGAGTAGAASQIPSFFGFPLGVSSSTGDFDETYNLTNSASFAASFITANTDVAGALTALLAGLADGKAYFNIHTTSFPGGEIRGFLAAVPEPGTAALLAGALLGLLAVRRPGRRIG